MDPESHIEREHSFIVRFWLERQNRNGLASEWRGVVEHVKNGQRHYFINPDEIVQFIRPYLQKISSQVNSGLTLSKRWQIFRLALKNLFFRQ